jgi:hypothetical protein
VDVTQTNNRSANNGSIDELNPDFMLVPANSFSMRHYNALAQLSDIPFFLINKINDITLSYIIDIMGVSGLSII